MLPRDYRQRLYDHLAARQPATTILYNHVIGAPSQLIVERVWPIARGANFLLDVGPDKHGLIPERLRAALRRLGQNLDSLGR